MAYRRRYRRYRRRYYRRKKMMRRRRYRKTPTAYVKRARKTANRIYRKQKYSPNPLISSVPNMQFYTTTNTAFWTQNAYTLDQVATANIFGRNTLQLQAANVMTSYQFNYITQNWGALNMLYMELKVQIINVKLPNLYIPDVSGGHNVSSVPVNSTTSRTPEIYIRLEYHNGDPQPIGGTKGGTQEQTMQVARSQWQSAPRTKALTQGRPTRIRWTCMKNERHQRVSTQGLTIASNIDDLSGAGDDHLKPDRLFLFWPDFIYYIRNTEPFAAEVKLSITGRANFALYNNKSFQSS